MDCGAAQRCKKRKKRVKRGRKEGCTVGGKDENVVEASEHAGNLGAASIWDEFRNPSVGSNADATQAVRASTHKS